MKIVYSFNKSGYEAECWEKEIRAASNDRYTFIPFNHGSYLDPIHYLDAMNLDRLYQSGNTGLMELYMVFESVLRDSGADAFIVTNAPPYHPDFLRKMPEVYKVLYSGDDPGATYMRNIPYLHAYQHVMYVSPGYSQDMDLDEKMRYCGMSNIDWLPISVFDYELEPDQDETTILEHERDIDIIYIGGFFRQKLDLLASLRKAFGRRLRMYGFFRFKHNVYYNVKYGFPGWMKPVSYQERVRLYQRAKIGFNIHWNEFGLGNQRLYHLPANGVMQICDCSHLVERVFTSGVEVETYSNGQDLMDKIASYLENDDKRRSVALNGYLRTMRDYRFTKVVRDAGHLIENGMERIDWLK